MTRSDSPHDDGREMGMRGPMALMMMLLVSAPALAASCSCSGGGGGSSYNFLGDPSVDIDMNSYDDFARSHLRTSSFQTMETSLQSRLILDLSDDSHVEVTLSRAGEKISGQGNMTLANETKPLEANGSLQGSKLAIYLVTPSGEQYRFDLAKEGSAVVGDYSRMEPGGERISGIAEGRWEE